LVAVHAGVVTTLAHRPAAFLPGGGDPARRRQVAEEARRLGWPAPEIYVGAPGQNDAALGRLRGAIAAGRHDALLLPVSVAAGLAGPLMSLLDACTNGGVLVRAVVPEPAAPGPLPAARPGTAAVLARAALEALGQACPDWLVWADSQGWHGRRRGGGFVQSYGPGAPAFYVHAQTAAGLVAQLAWQQAADDHAPGGCTASVLPPPPWGSPEPARARTA
jgi:hypothetical protein